MERFYLHKQLNGHLIEDQKGLRFANEEAACRFMPFVGLLLLPVRPGMSLTRTSGSR